MLDGMEGEYLALEELSYGSDERLKANVTSVVPSTSGVREVAPTPSLIEGFTLDVLAALALILPYGLCLTNL